MISINFIEDPLCVMSHFPCCFQGSLFPLVFNSLIIISLSVDLFELFLLGVHWPLWICRFMSFIKFRMVSAIISINILYAPFSLTSLLGTPIKHLLVHLMVPPKFWLSSLFFILFPFWSLDWVISVALYLNSLILPSTCWTFLVKFSFYLFYFSAPKSVLGSFL